MQSTSKIYQELCTRPDSVAEVKAIIAGMEYSDGDLRLDGFKGDSRPKNSNALFPDVASIVGNCMSAQFDISIHPTAPIPRMARIELYTRLALRDWLTGEATQTSEWLPKGVFFIDTREEDIETGILTIQGYDAMLKTEQPFTTTGDQGGWPMTDRAVVDEVCARIGVTLDARTAAILTKGYAVQYPGYGSGAYTMREVLGYVGAMYAGNWIITDAGELRLIRLNDLPDESFYIVEEHGDAITLGGVRLLHTPAAPAAAEKNTTDKTYLGMNVSKLDTAPAFEPYSKVIITVGQTTDETGNAVDLVYTAGDNTGRSLEFDCPWGTQQIANDVLAQVKGYAYQPYTATGALLDPAVELGDGVTVDGLYSVIAAMDVTFDALYTADISAPGDEEVDHEFPYESTPQRAINRSITQIRSSLKVGLDSITAEVSDLEANVNTSLSVLNGEISGKISGSDAQTLISQNMNTIRLSAVSGTNQSTISISAGGVVFDTEVVEFSNIIADSIVANSSITAPSIYGGKYYGSDGSYYMEMGTSGSSRGLRVYRDGYLGFEAFISPSYDLALSSYYGTFLGVSSTSGTLISSPYGRWNFKNATLVLGSNNYGSSLPNRNNAVEGQVFFLI